jgi:hypothetical protein
MLDESSFKMFLGDTDVEDAIDRLGEFYLNPVETLRESVSLLDKIWEQRQCGFDVILLANTHNNQVVQLKLGIDQSD